MAADDLDPTGIVSPLPTGLKLVRGLADMLQRWNEGPDRTPLYRDHYEEWIAKLAADLRELHGGIQALAERLDALEQDRERVLVLGNLGIEAWREAVDARRAMLGDAAVATVVSELSAAELARIERTIRMLDPEDLELLRALNEAARSALDEAAAMVALVNGTPDFLADRRAEVLQLGYLGGANLVAAGCVRAWDFGPRTLELSGTASPIQVRGAQVTPLGELVLRFMGHVRDEASAEAL